MVKVREDMTGWRMCEHGVPDSKLTVKRQVEDYEYTNGKRKAQWLCDCNCGNTDIIVVGSKLKSGRVKSCGCNNYNHTSKVRVKEDLTGHQFGRLTVLSQAEDYVCTKGSRYAQWLCECNCENHTRVTVAQRSLKKGTTTSCGCVAKEILSQRSKKYNRYEQKNNIVIGHSSNTDDVFYVDLKNFEKIKDICWYVVYTNNGVKRLSGYDTKNKKQVLIHQLLGFKNCDHIDMNELNNLENNLRQCNNSQNNMNRHRQKHNTSGFIGVSWRDSMQKWRVRISINKQETTIGYFVDKQDAIKARLRAELLHYGEFAPQRHLFEEYGIEVLNNEQK
jgi:hypothetical protein